MNTKGLAQLPGTENTPVSCANALITNNISATAILPLPCVFPPATLHASICNGKQGRATLKPRYKAVAAVVRRRETLPGDSGRMGGQVASRPSSHCSLRPLPPYPASLASRGTCLRRAPPPPLARGCASPREGLPPPQYRCSSIAALTRRTHRLAFSCQRGRVLRRFRQIACRVDT